MSDTDISYFSQLFYLTLTKNLQNLQKHLQKTYKNSKIKLLFSLISKWETGAENVLSQILTGNIYRSRDLNPILWFLGLGS